MIKDKFQEFYLLRSEDISGVSGTGIVARGVQFPSGVCVMEWCTLHSSIAFYHNINDVYLIHGHEGATKLMIGSPNNKKAKEYKVDEEE